jgi:hypothetical protein
LQKAKAKESASKATVEQAKKSKQPVQQISKGIYEAAAAAIETERLAAQKQIASGLSGTEVDSAFLKKAQSILDESRNAVKQQLSAAGTSAATPSEVVKAEAAAEVSASKPVEPIEDVILAIRGPGNAKCWKARVGGLLFDGAKPPSDGTVQVMASAMSFAVKAKALKGFDNLILLAKCDDPNQTPQFLKIPKEKPEPEKPAAATLTDPTGTKVTKGTAPLLEVKGTGLDQVKLIRFGDKGLEFVPDEKGKAIKIALTREVTADLGPATLFLHLADSKILTLSLQVVKSE